MDNKIFKKATGIISVILALYVLICMLVSTSEDFNSIVEVLLIGVEYLIGSTVVIVLIAIAGYELNWWDD